mmetsp:Transcript_31941/g.37231  ORF Transcript_31941/g.37231 Transcript_31941/m.37231 type:complete len:781 (-) Transcript_31941:169-2511(-)
MPSINKIKIFFFKMPNTDETSLPSSKRIKTSHHSSDSVSTTCTDNNTNTNEQDFEPIIPVKVKHQGGTWKVCQDGAVLYRSYTTCNTTESDGDKRIKIAGFDLNGTLLDSIKQFPHTLQEYELYNHSILKKLRHLHDHEHYNLCIFINQGGIRKAASGKIASKIKDLIEWLGSDLCIDRPISAFVSTMKKSGYHKPSSKMWHVANKILAKEHGIRINSTASSLPSSFYLDKESSFFVGDSVDVKDKNGKGDLIIGDDDNFAKEIGLKFSSTAEYFGLSNKEQRIQQKTISKQMEYENPTNQALDTRIALQSGYLQGPILLILCGPQGSGKSYFCHHLVNQEQKHYADDNNNWIHLSQDTINNGKPGTREMVEKVAMNKLRQRKKSVVVDRMHLDRDQRFHFIKIANDAGVPIHVVVLTTPRDVIADRVLKRTNHPGKVEGEKGSKMAQSAFDSLVIPKYSEGFSLITASCTSEGALEVANLYRRVSIRSSVDVKQPGTEVPESFIRHNNVSIPSIALGTFRLGKKVTANVVTMALELGFDGIDTAPTYNNEEQVGVGMNNVTTFCITKIPKRATTRKQVQTEITNTLTKMKHSKINLLLLHWPSDIITSDTLKEVWSTLEEYVKDGIVDSLGVCNFNIAALRLLLPHCVVARPTVLQIERHILLPQWDLVNFCAQHDIFIQAHSPLGQGELLEHDVVKKVSGRSGMSPAQVLLQWNLLQHIGVVTKCSTKDHLVDVIGAKNVTTPALSVQDMKDLNGIQEQKRFVCPPFMYGNEPFCWGK